MCNFLSWVEKGEHIYYLNHELISSEKGKELLKNLPHDDLIGHGAIRLFYGLEQDEGKNCECIDFSTPDNFPDVIVRAIKNGDMRGLATPEGLLSQQALAEYKRIEQPALAEYERIEQQALAEYKRIEQQALAEYKRIKQQAWAEYKRIEQQALAEYERIEQQAWAEDKRIEQQAWAEYKRIEQPALAEYKRIEQPAWEEYKRIEQQAWAEYKRIKRQAFWDLFVIPENRNPSWR